MTEKQNFYFTFGFGHGLAGYYVVIQAYNYANARDLMFELFGNKWCWCYAENEWRDKHGETKAEKYNYILFKTFDAHDYPETI